MGGLYLVTALRKMGAEVKVYAKHQDLTQASKLRGDVALDLLKRHSGIVWDPRRFRGIAPRRGLFLPVMPFVPFVHSNNGSTVPPTAAATDSLEWIGDPLSEAVFFYEKLEWQVRVD